jgi:Fe-S cluster biogenesis protein NfuA
MRTDKEVVSEIENLIVNQIQPSVSQHGGVVSLHSYKDGVASMFMSGACSGCASSTYTLKMGIENLLTHHIPEVKSVEGVDDPNSEVAPYYNSWEP